MTAQHPRITREKKTINKMVHVYCKSKHGSENNELCEDCTEFLEYARKRLDNCPFQEEKSTCGKCLVHCYQPVMKEKAKTIMRYSGPRLIYKSPILALHHVFDGRKKALTLKEFKNKQRNKK
jgi:predicted amidophosphoribosyltransferase